MSTDKVIIKNVGSKAFVKEIDIQDLSKLQEIVGGYIQIVPLPLEIFMVVNEEGMFMNLPINRTMDDGSVIYGNVFFCSSDGDDFTGLNEEQIEWLQKFFL